MAVGAPSDDATLMARELIQNSWDAARELRSLDGDSAPDFELRFEFGTVRGAEKLAMVRHLGLSELSTRSRGDGDKPVTEHRSTLGIPPKNALDLVEASDEPLRYLRVIESGTTGMYGPWEEDKSKLYLALVSHGMTEKESGAGGSYGYGKAGLIRGSRFRTVIAYTCFRATGGSNVTRRLLGMTYWGRHSFDGHSFTGFARFGAHKDDEVVPFENDAADSVAEQLGIATRTADDATQLGTTFLVIDPTCEPDELVEAICRNWWPALIENRFSVSVLPDVGDRIVPRPRKVEVLRAFIEGHEWASRPRDNNVPGKRRWVGSQVTLANGNKVCLGQLGLVSDIETWSYPTIANSEQGDEEDDARIDHRSLVALVRGPEMIVEYFEAGKTAPFVRGTFIADKSVDDFLRQTEPKAHDRWQAKPGNDIPPEATEVAHKVSRAIKTEVNNLRKTLKPRVPDPGEIRLPELERLFREITSGKGAENPPPPPGEPEHTLRVTNTSLAPFGSREIACSSEISVGLTERGVALATESGGLLQSQVLVKVQYVEDGRRGEEVPLTSLKFDDVDAPAADPHGWRPLAVAHDRPTRIVAPTAPYSADATTAVVAEVRVAPATGIAELAAATGAIE